MNYLKHLLLVFLSCMLFSCASDESEKLVPNEMFGDFVVLRLGFDGIAENKPGGTTKSTDDLLPSPQTFVEKIGDNLSIETTISPVFESDSIQTRSTASGLGSSEVLAIAYNLSDGGRLYKGQTFKANDAKIFLPQGLEFKIVFYSYNSDKTPDINAFLEQGNITPDGSEGGFLFSRNAQLKPFDEENGTDVVWCMIENTGKISTMTSLPNMLFTPIFTRIQWVLNSDKGAISDLDCSIQNTYAKASVRINDLHASGADMYNVWTPVGEPGQRIPFVFSTEASASVASDKKVFIADETKGTSLKINAISINGNAGKIQELSVGSLKRGFNYRVVSSVVPADAVYSVTFSAGTGGSVSPSGSQSGVSGTVVSSTATASSGSTFDGWYDGGTKITATTTSSNAYVSGNTLNVKLSSSTNGKTYEARFIVGTPAPRITWNSTTNRYELTIDPTDAGLYFKFGSIVGIFSGHHGNQVLPGTNSDFYDSGDVAYTPTSVSYGSWASIPFANDWVNILDTYHSVANVKAGKGDPCRLVGLDLLNIKRKVAAGTLTSADIDNGKWRLPRSLEYRMWASKYSNMIQLNGVTGRYFGPKANHQTNTPGGEFLPAAGYRNASDGTVNTQGWRGTYWSSDGLDGPGGYCLDFYDLVHLEHAANQQGGFPIRCISR